MSSSNFRSWLDSLFGLCFGLLLAAVAAYAAVQLIEAVWPVLLLVVGCSGVLAVGTALLLRRRDQHW